MTAIIRESLGRMRQAWRQILVIHLIYTGLGIVLFAPLTGLIGKALLALSGQPAVADMDLLYFALTPLGMASLVLFAAITIVVLAFELSSLMTIGMVDSGNHAPDALRFSLSRARQIFALIVRLVLRVLLLTLPFLAVAGVVAYLLLTKYDINYYLAVQPTVFQIAATIIGLLLIIMAALLIRRLIAWSLALPLVLFAGTPPARAFAASERLMRSRQRMLALPLAAWAFVALLLSVIITAGMRWLAAMVVPQFADSLEILAIVLGVIGMLWLLMNVLLTALTSGGLALLLTALARNLEPRITAADPSIGKRADRLVAPATRTRLALLLIVGVGLAVFVGSRLLDDIRVNDDVTVIAHRGAAGAAPENTLASVRRAIEDGTDWIEIDVQETLDGHVVVVHDSDFMKLAGVNLKVWEATLAQIRAIDVGSWFGPEFAGERVPTLAEVLDEVSGRSRLIIELKYYGHDQQLEQRVIDLVEGAGMADDTKIMSLKYAGIKKVRALRPDWEIGLLSAQAIGDLTRLDVDFLAVSTALAKPSFIRSARAATKDVYAWTVNDALSMSQMMSLGVSGIITDEPYLAREVIADRARMSSVERLLVSVALLFGQEVPVRSYRDESP